MFAKWFEEYQKILDGTRFISKLATFLISIYSLLNLYDLAGFLYKYPKELNGILETSLGSAIAFQLSLLVIFGLRFGLLFFNTKKVLLFSQILWILGFSLLTSYWFISNLPPEYGFHIDLSVFNYASPNFGFFGLLYLKLSPIRQFITLIISLITTKRDKI